MTPERLAELISKVSHGYNLINSEAREVLEHFGVEVGPIQVRCLWCQGAGSFTTGGLSCTLCNGCGYEVRK